MTNNSILIVTHYFCFSKNGVEQEAFVEAQANEAKIYNYLDTGNGCIVLRPKDAQAICDRWNRLCSDYYYSLSSPMEDYDAAKALVTRTEKINNGPLK